MLGERPAPYVVGSQTSRLAARKVATGGRLSQAERIFKYLREHELNSNDVSIALGIRLRSATARFVELERAGIIERCGRTTKTEAGSDAQVFRAIPGQTFAGFRAWVTGIRKNAHTTREWRKRLQEAALGYKRHGDPTDLLRVANEAPFSRELKRG